MQLICSIYGVEKTFFVKKICEKERAKYYSASELIKNKVKYEISGCKKSLQILDKQELLLEALSEIKDIKYIMGGHLCLINTQNKIERIPYEILKSMNIESVYLVVEEPEKIQNRLKNRYNKNWNVEFIDIFQQEEYAYAKFLSEKLNIPLTIIYNNREISNCNFLKKENIILPIKPIYAEKILLGEKKYEYRKRLCKKRIDKIYIYASAPVKMIIGEADIINKMSMDKEKLWRKTQKYAGITKEFYDQYFENQECAYAYSIGKVKRYRFPISLGSIGIEFVPQSFVYVGELGLY